MIPSPNVTTRILLIFLVVIPLATGCGHRSAEPESTGLPSDSSSAREATKAAPGNTKAVPENVNAAPENRNAATDDAERDSVRLFWEHYREATRLRQAGEYELASDAYEAALAQNEGHGDALYYLGNVSLELGRWEKARETWSRLIAVDPGSIRGHVQLAGLHFCRPEIQTFDLRRAEREYERANVLNPGETGPVLRLAEIALFKGNVNHALPLIDDILGQDESNLEALYLKAFMAWDAGRVDSGLSDLNEAFSHMEVAPSAPIAGEGDTDSTGGGGPAYAAGAACPLIDDFVKRLRKLGSPVGRADAETQFEWFRTRIQTLPGTGS